jgi:type I restriction enzyme S subunit
MKFNEVTLGEISVFYNNLRKPVSKLQRKVGTFPYYGAAGIQDYVSDYIFEGKYILVGEDGTVITKSLTPVIQIAYGKFWVNNHAHVILPRDESDFDYLYYAIAASNIDNLVTGAVQPKLSMTNLKSLELPWPADRNVRATIGKLLRSLDELIEGNIKLSKTLESIAQTIFKSWFIDFDPVRAKMAGEGPIGMDAETAELFPDSMEESELGMIPSGWTLSNIRGICDKIINGSTPLRSNKDFWDGRDLKWFKTGELADGFLLDSKEHISSLALERTSVKVLPKGAVLMAIYAAPTVGRLGILTSDATFNQACTGMLAQKKYGLEFLYLNLLFLRKFFNSRAIGAAQQNISKVVVEEAPVVLGSDQLHLAFSKLISPIFAQIESLTQQNRTLAEIRDALLPRLISGELQIPDEMLES